MKTQLMAIALISSFVTCNVATAQERQITVKGVGKVSVTPDTIVLSGRVQGRAKALDDALTKYQAAKRRLKGAIENSDIENLQISGDGPSVQHSSMAAANPNVPQAIPGQGPAIAAQTADTYLVIEQIELVIGGIQEIEQAKLMVTVLKLIGLAQDNGVELVHAANPMLAMMGMGNNATSQHPLVTYQLRDTKQLHQLAFQAAVDAAKGRAAQLATLTDNKVGKILSIEEVDIDGTNSSGEKDPASVISMIYGIPNEAPKAAEYASQQLGKIQAEVTLKLTFAIAD